jgi:starch synthase
MSAAEATPFAKAGGLGDVVGVLPAELQKLGLECAVLLPRYRRISLERARKVYEGLRVWLSGGYYLCDVWARQERGVTFYLLDHPGLYDRENLYGYGDDHVRFAVLSLATLGVARHLFRPDVIHLHDWHTAMTPLYLKTFFPNDPTFTGIKTLLTLHNLYDCRIGPERLGEIGLDPRFFRTDWIEFYGSASMLKAGLVFADKLSAVSPGYAREIQTPVSGEGYEGILRARGVTGILNGVDYSEWNPETDPHIAANYSAGDLTGKRKCKAALLEAVGFPAGQWLDRPLVGVVSRLVEQKGWELVRDVFHEFCAEDITLIVLGTGDYRYETMFWHMQEFHRQKVRTILAYDHKLAHQIYAGSDLFLMPSRYEPCGLSQMYSLRYATLPVVRATGGLDDTIDGETGFKFWGYNGQELLAALRYALSVYRDDRTRWDRMRVTAMQRDFSWDRSAKQYVDLFQRL